MARHLSTPIPQSHELTLGSFGEGERDVTLEPQQHAPGPLAQMTSEGSAVAPGQPAQSLLRRAAADPLWGVRQAVAVMRARYDLRACDRLGPRARVFGRCHVSNSGTIEIGERLLMYGDPVRCDLNAHAEGRLEIGDGVFVNFGCSISAHTLVHIGDRCRIGQYAIILDCDYHELDGSDGHGRPRPIAIGDGVWMGARVTVLKGVAIGDGAVIGAGSVVTRDISPRVLAAGVPACVIRAL